MTTQAPLERRKPPSFPVRWAARLLPALFLFIVAAAAAAAEVATERNGFVVRLRPGFDSSLHALDLGHGWKASIAQRHGELARVEISTDDPTSALARLRAHPAVRLASPNFATRSATTESAPNDPLFAWQWNLSAIGWERVRPILPPLRATRIAILDSGLAYVDWTNPTTGQAFARVPDLDRIQIVPGWDFVDGDALPLDENQHGTHVASVIASTANNTLGIAGLVDVVQLQPVRVLNADARGTLAELVEGLDWVATQNADVVNLSLTVDGSDDLDVLIDALDRVLASGAVIVAAAGNTHGDVAWPAAYPPVLSVGAVRSDGCANGQPRTQPTVYTSWGPQLDLVAPGGDNAIDLDLDGYPDGIPGLTIDHDDPTSTGVWLGAGTSFSAAHVAATAAILRGVDIPARAVEQLLIESADDIQPPGWDVRTGGGLLDPYAALDRAIAGHWSEPRLFAVDVVLAPASGNRTEATLTVRDATSGALASGITVYGHWSTSPAAYDSGVSDRRGEVRLRSPAGSGSQTTLVIDAERVGGAGFIGSITPGGHRFTRSLDAVAFTSIEPTGREPGCH